MVGGEHITAAGSRIRDGLPYFGPHVVARSVRQRARRIDVADYAEPLAVFFFDPLDVHTRGALQGGGPARRANRHNRRGP